MLIVIRQTTEDDGSVGNNAGKAGELMWLHVDIDASLNNGDCLEMVVRCLPGRVIGVTACTQRVKVRV
jgi:hypothetical protein